MREFHKYPVIFLNLKKDASKDYNSVLYFLKNKISNLFKYHKRNINFNELDEDEQQKWSNIEKEIVNESLLEESIEFLMSCLSKFYKRNCIVLIDEYDNILTNNYGNKDYRAIYNIIKAIFSSIFKSNDYLHLGIVTGCLSLAFNSLFSGVNNFYDCSQLYDSRFNDCYGFTEDEFNYILSFFGYSNINKKVIKEKYDGYSCGTNNDNHIIKNLYNPYSIMYFVDENNSKNKQHILYNYWINSGRNYILREILKKHEYVFEIDFLRIFYGNIIIVYINRKLDLDRVPFKKDDIWTVLLYSGYITLADQEDYKNNVEIIDDQITKLLINKPEKDKDSSSIQKYKDELKSRMCEDNMRYVKVPNKEVLESFNELLESTINDLLKKDNYNIIIDNYINNFVEGIFEKDINKINKSLSQYLMIFSSYHLFKHSNAYENVYQVLLMQLFIFWKVKGLTAEEDSGLGRYDIGFPNKNKTNEYILIEIKVYKTKEEESDKNNKNESDKNNKNENDENNKNENDKNNKNENDENNKNENDKNNKNENDENKKENDENKKENDENSNEEEKKNKMTDAEIEHNLHKECVNAIKQIEKKKYETKHVINNYNSFIKYGIAFYKKKCRVEMKINKENIQSPSNNYDDDDDDDDNGNNDNNNKKRKTTEKNSTSTRGKRKTTRGNGRTTRGNGRTTRGNGRTTRRKGKTNN